MAIGMNIASHEKIFRLHKTQGASHPVHHRPDHIDYEDQLTTISWRKIRIVSHGYGAMDQGSRSIRR